jgi:hypothetical protein
MRNDKHDQQGRAPRRRADTREKPAERFELPQNWNEDRTTPEERAEWLRRRAKGDHQ